MYIKDEWQKQRAKKGLIINVDSDYPSIKDKCVFNKFSFSTVYRRLWMNSAFLSLIVFSIVFLTTTSYDLTNPINLVKICVQTLLIYSVFLNLGIDEYVFSSNNDDNKVSFLKIIIQPFNAIKNKLIQRVVNYEYTHLNKNINNTLNEWFGDREAKNDRIGVFIIRLDRLVKKNKNSEVDDGLISLYEDLLYNLYTNYKDDNEIYIMDDLINIVPDFLIDKLGISIYELSQYISRQAESNMSRKKIKEEINKNIKDIKRDTRDIRDVTEDQIIEELLG
ncbi:MAG: hypothetical protein RSD22_09805 [Romboutsia sp.]